VRLEENERQARNVLGLLPGFDPDHKDEIVVVGAHYDHVGTDPDGAVYNGANDNAAGVAAMLEIARLWQVQGFRPARSVLFAAWDDHEQGLHGSRYYAQHPSFPLVQTVAVLNLDVIGVARVHWPTNSGPVPGSTVSRSSMTPRSSARGYPLPGKRACRLATWPATWTRLITRPMMTFNTSIRAYSERLA
jgi:Zn-dependent M28 family amino/carboxypeptidase